MNFTYLHPHGREMSGYIPSWLSNADPRPAREQLDSAYAHGGGWLPLEGWSHLRDGMIKYPGDPILQPVATGRLREETIYIYPYAWVGIFQPDGRFEIARMD